jgi:hypothetical protein
MGTKLVLLCETRRENREREKGQAKPDYITAEGYIILRRRTGESQESELSEAKFAKFFWDILSF